MEKNSCFLFWPKSDFNLHFLKRISEYFSKHAFAKIIRFSQDLCGIINKKMKQNKKNLPIHWPYLKSVLSVQDLRKNHFEDFEDSLLNMSSHQH